MKSQMKKLTMFLASLFLCLGFLFCTGMQTEAASSIPSKVRIYSGYASDYGFEVVLPKTGDTIKNLKSSSKNLLVKRTNISDYSSGSNSWYIGTLAKKEGTYKVTFDIYRSGKKVSSKTITVYAKNDSAVKTCKFSAKVSSYDLTTAKTSTVKVTMNKGYTLKKIEVGVLSTKKTGDSTSSEYTYKTIKNGGKFTLNTKAYYSESTYGSLSSSYYSHYLSDSLTASTPIRITYVDKYTKETATTTYSLCRWAS